MLWIVQTTGDPFRIVLLVRIPSAICLWRKSHGFALKSKGEIPHKNWEWELRVKMAEDIVLFSREEENVSLVANSEVSHRHHGNEDDETESASEFQTVELDESEAEEKGRDGVYEYENALRYIGFGPFHLLILFGTGIALASDSSEVLGVSYILEKSRDDFYTANDQYISLRESALSVIIFIGMMVGGYAWGSLSDLTGRRRALLMSLTLNGAAGVVSSLWRNYFFFLFCRFISGIG